MDYTAFRDSERAGWSARAAQYNDATARATLQTIPTVLAHAQLFPDAWVLDAGCGLGHVAACASLLGSRTEGVDFAEGMIAQARDRFPHLRFSLGDVENLPASDASFDAVLSNIVLFHVTDPARAMREAARVLRPGGRFVFSQWLGPDRSECYRLLFDILGRHADMALVDPAPNAFALSDEETVTTMMQAAGFKDIRSETVNNVLHAPAPSFFDFFMQFGVRVPLILAKQSASVRETIRTEIDAAASAFLSGSTYQIPMPSIVFSGLMPDE